MPATNSTKRLKARRLFGLGLALVFIVTVMLVLSLTVRVTRGVSRTTPTPESLVRLEILNGCSQSGIASKARAQLEGYQDDRLEIAVVRIGDFDLRDVARTFIISRSKDKSAAEYLAGLLKIDESEVIYRPLVNNYRQISATLVLGEDYVAEPLSEPNSRE